MRVRTGPRLLLALTLALPLLTVAGCGVLPPQGTAAVHPQTLVSPPSAQLSTVPVELGYVQQTVQVAGVIAPLRVAQVYFHNSGTITAMDMQVGQHVKQGQLLATFNTSNDLYQIAQQQLTIQSDRLQITRLLQQDAVAIPSSAGASQAAVALEDARIQLQQDTLQLDADELALHEDEVVAPFTGVVAAVDVQVGNQVAGDQIIGEIDDDSAYQLVAKLKNSEVQEVAPGDPAALALTTSTSGQVAETTVASIQVPTPDQVAIANQNKALGALATPQVTLALPSGFKATPADVGVAFQAQITVSSAQNVLYLPSDVISSFNGLDFVNVDHGGVVTEAPVELGLEGDGDTAILAGLKAGEQVVQP